MDAILERGESPQVDYRREIDQAKGFSDIKALFMRFFKMPLAPEPDAYKGPSTDYGLKARGIVTREKINAQCREILARVSDPAQLTPEDRETLLQYSGRGGLTENSQWEYYTPPALAQGVWDALKANGFENGNVLEPSCGAGVFLGVKPSGVVMTANDIDPVGSGVARLLNPGDTVSNSAFEQIVMSTEDDTFDSCVGNVPFGPARGASAKDDPAYRNEKQVERYFLLRILDKIKPGGLACLVVPTSVIGQKGAKWKQFRVELSKRAEFLGAHKLPSGTFGGKGGQGTDTVTDVIVLRKHGRDLLKKLRNDEIPFATLQEANVVWDEFVSGKYWLGEGRPFIMGRYVPRDAKDRFSRERVEGKIDDVSLRNKLARKFSSRINWEILQEAEPILRNYVDGDRRFINGDQYEYNNGEWRKVESSVQETAIDAALFGCGNVEELSARLQGFSGTLSFSAKQAFAIADAYPRLMSSQMKDAVDFARAQPEDMREQVYRGSLIGAMIAKMDVDEQAGEDVSFRRQYLQTIIVREIQKYGHPANNPRLSLAGQTSRAFGVFMNAMNTDGKFSDLLAGTLDKTKAKGYREDNVADIVSWLNATNGEQVELEDVKALYKGASALETLGDLIANDDVAITPDGMLAPMSKYCSGDVVAKMAELTEAVSKTDDEKLKEKFLKQIEIMDSRIERVPVEDITFGLQNKWFGKQYIVDFLRENGYPQAVFGEYRQVEHEEPDGRITTRKEFVEDYDAQDGEFFVLGTGSRKPQKFPLQLQKYLNGNNVTSNDAETISEYKQEVKMLEASFDAWMKQHPDSDDLAERYSLKFTSFVPPKYDSGDLGLDNIISGEIRPHSYQNEEVRRLSEQGSGICGFGTGLGKSFTALAMAGYNYKHGRAKRTCVVVPSAVLENWYHEARSFYSEAYMRSNVLFVGLEPKEDGEGGIERRPVLDEDGQPKIGNNGQPVMQDVVRFAKSKEDIYAAMWKIPQSNYSLVVMTKEKFQSIPVRPETLKTYTDDMVKRHLLSEKDAKKAEESAGKKSYADDVRKNALEDKFSNEGGAKKGELPYLEDMGFDSIITDESHFFKNSLSRGEKTGGVAGVPSPVPSDIAVDMAIKCDWLRRKNNGRGVYGLTATPVTNSPIEIFNMLSLVAPREEFEEMGIQTVDDFVRMFGSIEERVRLTVSNETKNSDTLVGFKNLQGLRALFTKYVNIKTVEDVDDEIHVPNAVEKEEEVQITDQQEALYEKLRKEAKAAAANSFGSEKEEDARSIFSIMRDMDRLSTDMDLFKRQMTFNLSRTHLSVLNDLLPTLPTEFTVKETDEETGEKIEQTYTFEPSIEDDGGETVSLIVHEQHESAVLSAIRRAGIAEAEISHPISPKYAKLIANLKTHLDAKGKQIVFIEEKTQHQKLKRILVHNLPIEESELGVINASDASGDKLDKISKAYNAGEIKIVIANKKAEVGVNLQKGTTAIHHLTLPWTPASINQRNGRGVRQGNKVPSVDIYYYVGKGTFDAYRKQLLQSKANWIGQLLTGRDATAENADISGEEEMIAMVSGTIDEYRARKAKEEEKKRDASKKQLVNRLKILASLQDNLETLEERRQAAKNRALADVKEMEERIERWKHMGKDAESVKRTQENLEKLKLKVQAVDVKYDAEKAKSESQRNMITGMLKQAAKKGELPFDERLIGKPEDCLVTLNGNIYAAGDCIEFPEVKGYSSDPQGLYRIERLERKENLLVLEGVLEGDIRRLKVGTAERLGKKVIYAASELALKKLQGGRLEYSDLPTSGVTRQQFEDNIDSLSLKMAYGAIMRTQPGDYTFISHKRDIAEGMQFVWPEPQNEEFRKRVLLMWLEKARSGSYFNDMDNLARSLFGENYKELAAEYGHKATPAEIAQIISDVWDNCWQRALETYEGSLYRIVDTWSSLRRQMEEAVTDKARGDGFDNGMDFRSALKPFLDAKKEEVSRLALDQAEEEKRRAEEKLRANPDYREIPEEMKRKFKEQDFELYYNQEPTRLRVRGGLKEFSPFSRLFIKDNAGYNGPLTQAKEKLKERFGASFTKDWREHFGAWWHVPATTDLQQLYDIIFG